MTDPLGLCPFWDDISANAAQGISIQQFWDYLTTPSAWGISLEYSTVNPVSSGGGGTYGVNLEYRASSGLQLYTYGTPVNSPSQGLQIGWSLTVNIAAGNGDWTGLLDNVGVGAWRLSEGGFKSVDTGGQFDPNNIGYAGIYLGVGGWSPTTFGVGSSRTNYEYW